MTTLSNCKLECGCEVELSLYHHGGYQTGKMRVPCSVHFGQHKVRHRDYDDSDEYQYRVGVEVDANNGVYKFFKTLESAERYYEQHRNPELVFQRKIKNTDKWVELNK
ncbi:hypothetical protein SEA_ROBINSPARKLES_70 [Gordonia phage RobinSparkles]|nr:hypothetical protein SEA_ROBINSPARKLES_70 [Gordonia phage RobinSparkles]